MSARPAPPPGRLGPSALVGRGLRAVAAARDRALACPAHDERTAALLGVALGVTFSVCFATGLYSHALQHPPSWWTVPAGPAGLYRVTQGLHVATGIASIPLLLGKLWSVYPRLFAWPPFRGPAHAVERAVLVVLVAGSLFMLFTGAANVARWYPWRFFFPVAHHWGAWITVGALVVHVGAKAPVLGRALGRHPAGSGAAPGEGIDASGAATAGPGLSRRAFLATVAGASGLLTATTVGQTVAPLQDLAWFAPRRPRVGPQGLPVNQAASEAGVVAAALDPGFRLVVTGAVAEELVLGRDDLAAMAHRDALLPIACVEGWSASARWGGVAVADLLDAAGVEPDRTVTVDVESLERDGLYGRSQLSDAQARAEDTLLALTIDGEVLDLDHGFPCRLVAGNRPGVLQTKWVQRLVVR